MISVVIPVFNAEKYLRNAVNSALRQEEVSEVVLVEDCSPDNCLAICQELAETSPKVRLLQHPDRQNHGAAESRNLGIRSARGDFIAFLDADDYYLDDRFKVAVEILREHAGRCTNWHGTECGRGPLTRACHLGRGGLSWNGFSWST